MKLNVHLGLKVTTGEQQLKLDSWHARFSQQQNQLLGVSPVPKQKSNALKNINMFNLLCVASNLQYCWNSFYENKKKENTDANFLVAPTEKRGGRSF